MNERLRYFSTFSGIGGFELGIGRALGNRQPPEIGRSGQGAVLPGSGADAEQHDAQGYVQCVGFSEIDKYAVSIYQRHFPDHTNYGDITTIEEAGLPDFDLFVGGFPCQAFSIAGRRRGFADTRGTLFFDIARILAAKRPRLCLLENVKGLLSHDEGRTFETIICALDELGYDLQWQVLNSKDFGVPQNRERVFIVGHLRGESRPEVFPIGASVANDIDAGQVASTNNSGGGGQGAKTGLYQTGAKIRRLTPMECERLQGFPDNWTEGLSDSQRYKCLGNAVTVNVIEAIVSKLI